MGIHAGDAGVTVDGPDEVFFGELEARRP